MWGKKKKQKIDYFWNFEGGLDMEQFQDFSPPRHLHRDFHEHKSFPYIHVYDIPRASSPVIIKSQFPQI